MAPSDDPPSPLTRRLLLQILGAAAGATLAPACGGSGEETDSTSAGEPGGGGASGEGGAGGAGGPAGKGGGAGAGGKAGAAGQAGQGGAGQAGAGQGGSSGSSGQGGAGQGGSSAGQGGSSQGGEGGSSQGGAGQGGEGQGGEGQGGAGQGGSSGGGQAGEAGAGQGGAGSSGASGQSGQSGQAQGGGGQGGSGVEPTCADPGGLTPDELLAPIDTIVVLMMENRSFDHYLGALKLLEGKAVDGLVGDEINPAPDGSAVKVFAMDDFTPADPPHGWDACHAQWNKGKNDGFVKEHEGPDQHQVMGYHTRAHIPITYALADASAVCDRWFASVMGPTWPNRFYLHGATSKGQKGNAPVFGFKSLFDQCKEAGLTSRQYYSDVAWASGGYLKVAGNATIETFFDDAAAGKLPNFSIIDPGFFGASANDDHPDHDIQLGQALIASVFAALAQSPQWDRCLFILTYDEHGGFYDHVPPPTTVDDNDEFKQLGFRVPTLVCGPFVRKGCVVSTTYEHVSVASTVARRFKLPPLNARAAATKDVSDCIHPAYLAAPQPPPVLPQLDVSIGAAMARARDTAGQPELGDMADRGLIPAHLDRRREGRDILRRVLEAGARLGALRLRP